MPNDLNPLGHYYIQTSLQHVLSKNDKQKMDPVESSSMLYTPGNHPTLGHISLLTHTHPVLTSTIYYSVWCIP